MIIAVKIANPDEQGVPVQGLPWRSAPESFKPLPTGVMVDGKVMTSRVSFADQAESYEGHVSAKWNEVSPLAALNTSHRYGQTSAPRDSLPRITVFASELAPDVYEGAQRLAQLLDWLEFLTMPFSRLGEPPLLQVTVGYRAFYARLTDADPKIDEWMLNRADGKGVGLPYQASFSLNFIREPDGLSAIRQRPEVAAAAAKNALPISNRAPAVTGGSGGITPPGVPTTAPPKPAAAPPTGRAANKLQIILDPGHGQLSGALPSDPGAVGGGTTEAEQNLAVAFAMQEALSKAGHTVRLTRTTGVRPDWPQRTSGMGQADLYLSLHHDTLKGRSMAYYPAAQEVRGNPEPALSYSFAQCIRQVCGDPEFVVKPDNQSNYDRLYIRDTLAPVGVLWEVDPVSIESASQLAARAAQAVQAVSTGIARGLWRS